MTLILGKDVDLAALAQQLGRPLGTRDERVFGYAADGTFEDIAESVLRAAIAAYVPPPLPPDPRELVAAIRAATTLEELRAAVAAFEESRL
jgi:hypothetical protein